MKMAKFLYFIIILFCVSLLLNECKCETRRPHIIFIMADDLGWNDVGFHGSSQIPTPNIDALAYSGLILNNYYVPPLCTPSRSAFMTGKYPIHTGMQHLVLYGAEARGLSLNETLFPQYLKGLGYSTHIVGKWHLGSYKKEYTPLYRGFDSHLGHWTGHHDYFDHTAVEPPGWGLDMRRNMDVAYDLHGVYSTDVYTNEAEKLITNHNTSKPLFLYLSHAAVHSGNPYNPIPAQDEYVAKFDHIKDFSRRRFAAVLTKLDESVGKVVKTLNDRGMLEDSIIVFSTDNGGAAEGFDNNAASNWPLRGVKDTLWEGGVRGSALLWSGSLLKPQRVARQTMHMVDWLPTLYRAAGGDVGDLGNIDGLDMWDALTKDEPTKRNEVLHNIDDIYRIAALTVGEWKIIKGSSHIGRWNLWYGPHSRSGNYATTDVSNSPSGKSLASINRAANVTTMTSMRSEAEVQCTNPNTVEELAYNNAPCLPFFGACLFNIMEDPCERQNLASLYPEKLKELRNRLEELRKTALPPANLPLDDRGDPKHWGYVWTNFGDFSKD